MRFFVTNYVRDIFLNALGECETRNLSTSIAHLRNAINCA